MSPRAHLAAVPLLALLALGCQDQAGPLSPERAGPRASLVASVCDAEADARAHAILNLIFLEGERDAWHLQFNKGRQAAEAGDIAGSWALYVPLLAEIAARANAAPAGSDLPGLVNELTSLILVCSRQPAVNPALLELLNLPEEERILRDIAFTIVSPGANLSLVTPKRHFGITAPGEFFDETALLIVSRIPDQPPFTEAQFAEFPPRFNVTLLPYTAQSNFDNVGDASYGPEDVLTTGARAQVAICPGPDHPEDGSVRVLRRPEGFLNEPTALLPWTVAAIASSLTCDLAGSDPYPSIALTSGERVFAGLSSVAARMGGLLLPSVAHALDGGIGGETALFSDFVAASPVLDRRAPVVDRVIFTVGGNTVTHLPLAPNPTETVTAVAQRAVGSSYETLTRNVTCSWSSTKPTDISITAKPGARTAKVTRAAGYTGAAKVTAVCNGTAGTLQILPGTAQGG